MSRIVLLKRVELSGGLKSEQDDINLLQLSLLNLECHINLFHYTGLFFIPSEKSENL